MGSTQENKELVRQAFEAVEAGQYDRLNEFITEDYKRHCQATPEVKVECLEDFISMLKKYDETFSEVELTVDMYIAEGDLVAFWGSYKGVQTGPMGPFPPTGKVMDSDMGGVHRIHNDKIAETWVTWDNLSALGQLGLLPPQT